MTPNDANFVLALLTGIIGVIGFSYYAIHMIANFKEDRRRKKILARWNNEQD